MATFHDANLLAKAQAARATAARTRLRLGHRKMANEQYEEALQLLSGTTTKKELEAMGAPFGRKAGINGQLGRQRRILGSRSMLSVLPINVQTDRLRQALKLNQRNQGSQQVFVLQVSRALAPYAKYILSPSGTVRMVTRPFWEVLQKSFKRRNFELLIKTREELKKGV